MFFSEIIKLLQIDYKHRNSFLNKFKC